LDTRVELGIAGRVALVTGASKGLGLGIATALAREGARVAVASRSRERVEEAAEGIGARAFVHDVADLSAAPGLVGAVENELGPLDILVTNTGGPPANPDALAFTPEQWEAAYRSLVLGPMAFIEAALPGMRERGWGRVLNVSSSAVREPIPVLMLSNAHRSAMLAAFKTLARQVAGDGVTLNSLLPGRIATDRLVDLAGSREAAEAAAAEQVPAGRLGTVEEFAAAAAFLCSEPASYITGVALLVDGGLTQSV
jgi:3-oxoacyl-[acyl-carrier protein] reductase